MYLSCHSVRRVRSAIARVRNLCAPQRRAFLRSPHSVRHRLSDIYSMETAFARAEQRLGICLASGSNRNWRAVSQPTLYRTRPERLHDADRALICLFCNRRNLLIFGSKWARSAMFPLFFLAFMIPLPEAAVDSLENASKVASWKLRIGCFR